MDINKPKKIILQEKRIILQEKIQKLFEYGFSGVELSDLTKIPSNEITAIAKRGDKFPISLDKSNKYLKKIEKIIISLK